MEKKNVIFLSVIAVATLLTAVIGTTFAYFTATVSGNDRSQTTTITTANLGVTFTDGQMVDMSQKITPEVLDETKGEAGDGIVGTKTFTIKNDSAVPVVYTVTWKGVTNTLPVDNDVKYNLEVTTDGLDTEYVAAKASTGNSLPRSTGTDLISSVVIPAGVTHTYVMSITFIDDGSDQSDQQDKTFIGTLNVSAVQQNISE